MESDDNKNFRSIFGGHYESSSSYGTLLTNNHNANHNHHNIKRNNDLLIENNKNHDISSSSNNYGQGTMISNNERMVVNSTSILLSSNNDHVGDDLAIMPASSSSSVKRYDEDMVMNRENPNNTLRRIAIDLSLYFNLLILVTKLYAYVRTLSLSVLAALVDSLLDVVSQIVLNYTEKHSSISRSSALYPAGASRLEPVGVLTCAALMGMASFEILKESIESLLYDRDVLGGRQWHISSFYNMISIVVIKLGLYALCRRAARDHKGNSITNANNNHNHTNSSSANNISMVKQSLKVADPTLDALAQDHWNDCLSNTVAAISLLAILISPSLWFVDPVGAILISVYIIHSWYETGKEQIEQLTGKCAPKEFVEELYQIASNFDERMAVDVCRAYHFGPKFLVELEVVLPRDTLLFESHDLGMDLQYEIEGREEVERCFVHIDYESRPYDEHVVSKVPELREKYLKQSSNMSGVHSV
mmetsp:Transcript_15966/g.22747  ORF Transcript_15966/g.22747 Transcript_15966/m.22747 type:complete len:475 (-) Transcript_15966:114-1538(-)|eukprot:CAMPEP_0184873800 /NCGR_PEP_ID=MMETSP0580-20130426/42040_1 /TAXON_ID=1118495 /ORGANISM="Dactyliosolen fragilissimus" /LENGTH=474 /DNA_ID=CAMNT_0027376739 /DNA_START=205 /DNA_END=1629 /DNA_ORIENTATION=+